MLGIVGGSFQLAGDFRQLMGLFERQEVPYRYHTTSILAPCVDRIHIWGTVGEGKRYRTRVLLPATALIRQVWAIHLIACWVHTDFVAHEIALHRLKSLFQVS